MLSDHVGDTSTEVHQPTNEPMYRLYNSTVVLRIQWITHPCFKCIMISSVDKYAHKAIKYGAIDYLLKPVVEEELSKAVNESIIKIIQELHDTLPHPITKQSKLEKQDERIIVKTQTNHYLVTISDIEYIHNKDNKSNIHIHGRDLITSPRNIDVYQDMLNNKGFVRVHDTYLINLKCIDKVDISHDDSIILKGGMNIPISEPYKLAFFNIINHLY